LAFALAFAVLATMRAYRRSMTEDELLKAITDAMTAHGWIWTHHRRSDRAQLMGHPGLPDIIAARGRRAMALELKSAKGKVSEDQRKWLAVLSDAGLEAEVVRPDDLNRVLEWLK